MKHEIKRLAAGSLAALMVAGGVPARAAAGSMTADCALEGDVLSVTVSVHDARFLTTEIDLRYDTEKLTPVNAAGEAAAGLREAVALEAPEYDAMSEEVTWATLLGGDKAFDPVRGAMSVLLMVDPQAGDSELSAAELAPLEILRQEGQAAEAGARVVRADAAGLTLYRLRFRVAAGAKLYTDSIRVEKSLISGVEEDGTQASAQYDVLRFAWNGLAEQAPQTGGGTTGGTGGESGKTPETPETETLAKPGETGGAAGLRDVPEGAWYASYVRQLSEQGILTGYEDGTFRPEARVTRAECAAILTRAKGLTPAAASGFSDVTDWSAPYVGAAAQAGYLQGDNGRFRPDDPATREELVTILSRAGGWDQTQEGAFSDDGAISAWARNAVYAGAAKGVVSGYEDGAFRPGAYVTRAEAAKLVALGLAA